MDGKVIQFPDRNAPEGKGVYDSNVQKETPVEEAQNTEEDGEENEEGEEPIDLGDFQLPQVILEVRNFVDVSKGAQLVAFIDTNSKRLAMLKGSAVFPVMTKQGPRGVQVEIDFPLDSTTSYQEPSDNPESDLMKQVKVAFDSYDALAEKAVVKRKKEMEDESRIVSASGLPFDPKGTKN